RGDRYRRHARRGRRRRRRRLVQRPRPGRPPAQHRPGGRAERLGRARRGAVTRPDRGGNQARGGDLAGRARAGPAGSRPAPRAGPGRDGRVPAWHIGRDPPGAAYVVTGPGEQPLPGVAGAARVTVTVPSKDTGGALVTWTAGVHRVDPGSPEWDAVIGPLAAAR